MSEKVPRLRQSLAKLLVTECPEVARQVLEGEGRAPTKVMRRGTLVDQLVFGGRNYQVVDAKYKSGPRKGEAVSDWTATDARVERARIEGMGLLPVLPHELDSAQSLAGRIRSRLIEAGIVLENCRTQETLRWDSPLCNSDGSAEQERLRGEDIACEGTPDAVCYFMKFPDADPETKPIPVRIDTIDLKVGDANPENLDGQCFSQGWDIQGVAYQEAVHTLNPSSQWRGRHIIVRADPKTLCVSITELGPQYMIVGKVRWEEAKRIWHRCITTNQWPEYEKRVLTPPRWVWERYVNKE